MIKKEESLIFCEGRDLTRHGPKARRIFNASRVPPTLLTIFRSWLSPWASQTQAQFEGPLLGRGPPGGALGVPFGEMATSRPILGRGVAATKKYNKAFRAENLNKNNVFAYRCRGGVQGGGG